MDKVKVPSNSVLHKKKTIADGWYMFFQIWCVSANIFLETCT